MIARRLFWIILMICTGLWIILAFFGLSNIKGLVGKGEIGGYIFISCCFDYSVYCLIKDESP